MSLVPNEFPTVLTPAEGVPALLTTHGSGAVFVWEEWLYGVVRSELTRQCYRRAVVRFLHWCEAKGTRLNDITPGDVGRYLEELPVAIPGKKQALAAIKQFGDVLVQRHLLLFNPAASVRAPAYTVVEGRTPEITPEQVRVLMASISSDSVLDLRDRAVLSTLLYTGARVGATAKLRRTDLLHDGSQSSLRFHEKNGKQRQIPCRTDLEQCLRAYLVVRDAVRSPEGPLFLTVAGKSQRLTANPLTAIDVCRMLKKRLLRAGLPTHLSPHAIRVAVITSLLNDGVPLNDVAHLAGHSDMRTTKLYDRRPQRITRNIVERISL